MSLRLRIGTTLLAAGVAAAGVAGFVGRASSHPNVEPSAAAACAGCHMTDYRGARDHAGKKPTTCGVCHAQDGWHPTRVDHRWPLTGAHARAQCFACHRGDPPAFHGTPKACFSCHEKDYDGARDHMNHFPTTCEECHSTEAWKPTLPRPAEQAPKPVTPPPRATASASARPVTTAPRRTAVTPKPRPTVKPRPTSVPTATTTAPTTTKPDTITGPSPRRR